MQRFNYTLRSIATLLVFLTAFAWTQAQPRMNITASGYIIDAKTSDPLYAATVKVTSSDGGTGTFGISDTLGKFEFNIERPGKYTLEFSYMGYKGLTKEVNIWPGRGAALGKFKLEEDAVILSEVGTVARSQRVKQVGDTIMYNADAYKVQDGASAEELVAKMPGIEVTDDGVKAQGETVEKILVDGKAFFENDPKLALKTLPAEVVQSVSVFDKKSDQAEFTGFDDGNTVKAMDLTTKSYRRNGVFGKVYGSIGLDEDINPYYNAGFNLNLFSGNRRLSLLGMSNNVNQQDFSFDDLMSSGGMGGRGGRMGNRVGSQSGVSRANAFGLNFNDTYLNEKLDVQGSYFFNMTRTTLTDSIADDYINTERSAIQTDDKLSHNFSHRVNMRISYKPNDYNEIMFRPSFNYQKADSKGLTTSSTWRYALDSVLLRPDYYVDPQNTTSTLASTESNSWNAGGELLWRHKFDKDGRTLSVGVESSVSGSSTDTENNKILNGVRTLQGTDSDSKNYRLEGNAMWTEPLGENQQLSLRYETRYTHSSTDKVVGYYGDEAFTLRDSIDANNSSKYTSDYLTQSGELGYRLHTDYINMNVGVAYELAELDGKQNYNYWTEPTGNPSYTTSKTFNSVLPNLRFEWTPQQGTQMSIRYRVNSSAPSVSNLQQSVNTANELSYSTGNPDLDQSVEHSIRARFLHSNMDKATNIMFYSGVSLRKDYVGTQYVINNSDATVDLTHLAGYGDSRYNNIRLISGGKISKPINMSGYQSAYGGLTYGFPFDLIMSNVNVSMDANYGVTPSQQLYYNGTDANGTAQYDIYKSKIRSLTLTPSLSVTSNISQDLDFSLSYRPAFQKVKDTQNDGNNYDYLTHSARAKVNWVIWNGFTMEQQLNYTCYTGSSMTTNEDEWIWNASIGKKFMKNNVAEIKIQAYDILNSRTGFSRSVSDSYIRTSYTNFMPRYFMLTFTYKIANYKGSSEIKSRSNKKSGNQGGGMPPM